MTDSQVAGHGQEVDDIGRLGLSSKDQCAPLTLLS